MDERQINQAMITYIHQPAKVNCDRNCRKAFGRSLRPRFGDAMFPDSLCGDAPDDPGTYEGEDAKPLSPDDFPNRWCVRECERCNMSAPGKWREPLEVLKF